MHAATIGLNASFVRPATRGDIRDRLGRFAYLLAAAYAMRRRTVFGCELSYAGTTEKVTLTQLSVPNAPVFGGPLQLSVPDSNPDDCLLDMLAIGPITPGRMLRAFGWSCQDIRLWRSAPALPDGECEVKGVVLVSITTPSAVGPQDQDTLQELATERIYRLRRFKVHLIGFVLGLPVLGAVWVLSEYFEEHTWPSRFASAPDVAGTWDPWFFFAAGIWLIILVIHALRAFLGPPVGPLSRYIRRPIARAELDREVERLKGRR